MTPPVDPTRLAARFREWTGRFPDGLWQAPGRVNLIGEHLDYNGGHVMPFAVDRAVRVAVGRRAGTELRLRSLQYESEVVVPLAGLRHASGWAAYPAGVVWVLARSGVDLGGADVLIDSDVPPGAGLSSSAAVTCALALAVVDLTGGDATSIAARRSLVAVAQEAETEVAGAPVGNMDQAASLLSRAGHALYLDTRTLRFRHLPLPLGGDGCHLLAVDTGASHHVASGAYAERRQACEGVAAALGSAHLARVPEAHLAAAPGRGVGPRDLRLARHVVTEQARTEAAAALLAGGRLADVGPLMTASHRSLQHDFANSTTLVDAVVDAALAAGALGARMTGAGWGGTVVALVRSEAAATVGAAAREAVARGGGPPAEVLDVVAAAGASRLG